MNKKFLSVILAVIFALSAVVILPSQAAEVTEESSSANKGTFLFDSGDWNAKRVLFYIFDDTTKEYASKLDGWVKETTWASGKRSGGTPVEGKEGVFESFEVDLSGRENHTVLVIFLNPDTAQRTFDCVINSTVFGHTAKRNGVRYYDPIEADEVPECVSFDGGSGLGAVKHISRYGIIGGEIIPSGMNCADVVATYILKSFNNFYYYEVTYDSVQNAISEFGTNRDDVWKAYLTHSGEDNYNEPQAKKVIYGSGEEEVSVGGLFGEVDGDRKITSSDALVILRASVGLEELTDIQEVLANVDSDEKITSSDALEVLRVSVGLSTNSKAGTYGILNGLLKN